jgi:hypothetical protein
LSPTDYKDVQGKADIHNWKPANEDAIKRNARYILRMKATAAAIAMGGVNTSEGTV